MLNPLCRRSTTLHPQFLNLMNIVAQRAGAVHIRVGGNTQETAFLVDTLPGGKMMEKDKEDASNPVRLYVRLGSDVARVLTETCVF